MKLYDFQETGKAFLKDRRYALLADDMGLGKTAQAIMAIKELPITRVLVICPASVKYNWKKEIEKWDPTSGYYNIQILDGNSKFSTSQYTIVNYDLTHRKKIFTQLITKHWDLIICDEAHYLKNNSAKRTKVVYYPKGLKDRTDRVWLLTGTPILNRPVELFSHLKALIPDKLGPYQSYKAFTERYCDAYDGKWGWDASGASNMAELSQRLDGFMLRRMKEDVLEELPDKTYQTITLPASKKLQQLTIKERGEHGKEKEGVLGELATIRRQSGLAKVPLVVQHVKDVLEDKQKAVIFAYHRDVISALMESCKAYSPVALTGATPAIKRQEAIETFKSKPECRLFIGQVEAAGTGIDGLQDVCDTVVFAEMTWVPGQIHQAIDRCHRIGQKNPVLAQFLLVENSIDEDVAASVAQKEKVIKKIVKPTVVEELSAETMLARIANTLEKICDSLNCLQV